ncbi:unnamed protein product [Cyprideis torosa]|uniref:Uncharacterized protein n=1 Tax=Cyprideis torosa TaxID=163714 RepID=A0A7R8WL88_9CRUS|nr:unnamed protein product [Cyprideis torosa]CAG0896937.1 unnamed protein product [Cyprideis torosa]
MGCSGRNDQYLRANGPTLSLTIGLYFHFLGLEGEPSFPPPSHKMQAKPTSFPCADSLVSAQFSRLSAVLSSQRSSLVSAQFSRLSAVLSSQRSSLVSAQFSRLSAVLSSQRSSLVSAQRFFGRWAQARLIKRGTLYHWENHRSLVLRTIWAVKNPAAERDGRKNPNGCPIHATFYISHQYTNYRYVQELWNDGHEIAAHSITHRTPERWWSENATIEDWFDEMVGIANIINRFGGVRIEDIRGVRVPFLREYSCAMVDSCPPMYSDEEVYEMLMMNFKRHYHSNRAPFGLFFHTVWFKSKQNLRAFRKFLDELTSMQDVYIVSTWEMLQWMQDPTPLGQMPQFQPWLVCKEEVSAEDAACKIPKACKLKSREHRGDRYLHTCFECPDVYPWIKNEFGLEFK